MASADAQQRVAVDMFPGAVQASEVSRRHRTAHTRILCGCLGSLFVFLQVVAAAQEAAPAPDWIPVGSVRPEVARRAVTARAQFESGDAGMQRSALQAIARDVERYGRAELQTAAVPLIVDLLGTEYRILETPRPLSLEPRVRIEAMELLGRIGGSEAREQLRHSLEAERDPTLRVAAASYLASMAGPVQDSDYQAIADAFARAVRRGGSETEITRLLPILQDMSVQVWSPEYRPLLEALVVVAGGPYSSSARSRAMSFLEALSER